MEDMKSKVDVTLFAIIKLDISEVSNVLVTFSQAI